MPVTPGAGARANLIRVVNCACLTRGQVASHPRLLIFAAIDACLEPFIIAADGRARPLRRDVLSLCIDRDLGLRLLANIDVSVWYGTDGLNVCVCVCVLRRDAPSWAY